MKALKSFICLVIVLLVTFSSIYSEDEYDKELIKKSLNKVVIIKVKGDSEFLHVHKKAGFQRVKFERWEGSGVILSSDGIIVTNNHVIQDGDKITVITYSKKKYPAKVLVRDPDADLALIKINADNLEYMEIGDISKSEEGDDCWALGNTLGLGFNISKGMITSLNQNILHSLMVERFLRFNAKINHGNSGGALINKDGKLLGIPTIMKLYDYKERKMHDFNLAIPAYLVKSLFSKYKRTKTFYRSWIGIAVMQNNQKNRDFLNFKGSDKGYLVEWIFPNSPAQQRGLKVNDIILEINSVKFKKLTAIQDYIYNLDPGTELKVKYLRNNEVNNVTIKTARLIMPPERFPPDFCLLHFLGMDIDKSLRVTSIRKGSKVEKLEIPKKKLRAIIPGQTFDKGYEIKVRDFSDLTSVIKRSHLGHHQFSLVMVWGKGQKDSILFIVDDKLPFLL